MLHDMKKLLLGIGLFCVFTNFAQHTIIIQSGKKYPATQPWEFIANSYVYDANPKVQIAKTEAGGLLKISVKVSNEKLYVGERIFINLKNNVVIYCLDKGMREFKDGIASTLFLLNAREMKQLQNHDIADVRFKIIGKRSDFDSQIGTFTASNVLTVFDAFSPDKKTIDTKSAIAELYKKK